MSYGITFTDGQTPVALTGWVYPDAGAAISAAARALQIGDETNDLLLEKVLGVCVNQADGAPESYRVASATIERGTYGQQNGQQVGWVSARAPMPTA